MSSSGLWLDFLCISINPVKDFQTKYWAWWLLIQPDFCLYDDEDDLLLQDENGHVDSAIDGDWEVMRKSGVNGWVSIVVGLCFWYWLVSKMGTDGYQEKAAAKWAQEDWLSAVKDVSFVLTKAMDYST